MKKLFWILGCVAALAAALLAANALFGCCKKTEEAADCLLYTSPSPRDS